MEGAGGPEGSLSFRWDTCHAHHDGGNSICKLKLIVILCACQLFLGPKRTRDTGQSNFLGPSLSVL